MFFFGIASNLFTIAILGIFSLVFFYQGIQMKYFSNTSEDTAIAFEEKSEITSNYFFTDLQTDVAYAETSFNTIPILNTGPTPIHNVCQCARWKCIDQTVWSHRGPPAA